MRFYLAAILVLAPAVAFADDAPPPRARDAQQMKTDDCARARKQNKTCVLDMGTETLEGTVGKGDGERIGVKVFEKMGSMIRIRRDFIAEMIKSAEDL